MKVMILALLLLSACSQLPPGGEGKTDASERLQRDIHEQLISVPVAVRDRAGRRVSGNIPVTLFRPDGEGPFPLVVINHGRVLIDGQRAKPARQRMESAARFFVRKGFAVAVPTRLGYGATAAVGELENGGACHNEDYVATAAVGAAQIRATVERLRGEPWVMPDRVLIVGDGTGGFAVTAAASEDIPGLVAAISFSGGQGGDSELHPGEPCSPSKLAWRFEGFGHKARVPMLWVYTRNDLFFSPAHTQAWARRYNEAGGHADYRLLPAFGDNGHALFAAGNDLWQALVDAWLEGFGFTQPGTLAKPPASGLAAIDDAASAPLRKARVAPADYARFLGKPLPRAFALGLDGRWGQAQGDDALSKALAFCQSSSGEACALYAVDQDVVWPAP